MMKGKSFLEKAAEKIIIGGFCAFLSCIALKTLEAEKYFINYTGNHKIEYTIEGRHLLERRRFYDQMMNLSTLAILCGLGAKGIESSRGRYSA